MTRLDRCHPAAFRRLGPLRNNSACFVVRDHNGQALAYVFRGIQFRPAPPSASATAAPPATSYAGQKRSEGPQGHLKFIPARIRLSLTLPLSVSVPPTIGITPLWFTFVPTKRYSTLAVQFCA